MVAHKRLPARLAWIVLGIATGISLALFLVAPPASPFFLAPLGGSAVFLFGLTRAPAVQPRALLGGHLGGRAPGYGPGSTGREALAEAAAGARCSTASPDIDR